MEEDILNYSPTVMFRGTPCIYRFIIINYRKKHILYQDETILNQKNTHSISGRKGNPS